MNTHRLRQWLWLTATCCIVLSLMLVTHAAIQPATLPPQTATESRTVAQVVNELASLPSLHTFSTVWDMDLRRPLYDPPPPPPPEPVKIQRPPLQLRVVGTMIEPDFSQAMVITKGGGIELAKVGDKPDGIEVLVIAADHIVVQYYDEQITLKIEGAR